LYYNPGARAQLLQRMVYLYYSQYSYLRATIRRPVRGQIFVHVCRPMVIIRPARSHGGCRTLEDEPALTISTEMQKNSTREVDRKEIS